MTHSKVIVMRAPSKRAAVPTSSAGNCIRDGCHTQQLPWKGKRRQVLLRKVDPKDANTSEDPWPSKSGVHNLACACYRKEHKINPHHELVLDEVRESICCYCYRVSCKCGQLPGQTNSAQDPIACNTCLPLNARGGAAT
eukprot:1158439-Pelagomonas_calceolata.AAC.7